LLPAEQMALIFCSWRRSNEVQFKSIWSQ